MLRNSFLSDTSYPENNTKNKNGFFIYINMHSHNLNPNFHLNGLEFLN